MNDKKCSIKINQRGIIWKLNKVELWFLCTALRVIAKICISSLESFGPIMTKLRSRQEKWDAAAASDQSNPYMSPGQATQKVLFTYHKDKLYTNQTMAS